MCKKERNTPCVGDGEELLVRAQNGAAALENGPAVPQKPGHRVTM